MPVSSYCRSPSSFTCLPHEGGTEHLLLSRPCAGFATEPAIVRTRRRGAKDDRGKDRQVLNAVHMSPHGALVPVTALGQVSLPFGNPHPSRENSRPSVNTDRSEEHEQRPDSKAEERPLRDRH